MADTWPIDNGLLWSLDVMFREGTAKTKQDDKARYEGVSTRRIRLVAAMSLQIMPNVLFDLKNEMLSPLSSATMRQPFSK